MGCDKLLKLMFVGVFVLMVSSLYMIFVYAPVEKTMGWVQKIFYYHLAAAFTAFLAFFVVFVSAIIYLVKKESKYDIVGESAAEIGIVFTTIVLISGVLWAKPIWNIWWTWDPRLTTTFILWLIYIAYLLLRINLRDNVNMPTYAAIFGIIGFLDVPLVFMSIRWWRTIHPVVIRRTSIGLTKEMINVLIISIIANIFLFVVLLMLRVRIGKVQNELEVIKSIMEEELDRSKV